MRTAEHGRAAINVSGIVVAGGRSQRLGQDKRWLLFHGQPLLRHVVETLRPLVDEVIVVTRSPQVFAGWEVRAVTDVYAECGVLAGVHAGLQAAQGTWGLVVAADLPFLQPPLLQALIERASGSAVDAVVPLWRGFPEPLVALYRPATCVPAIETALARGERRVVAFHADVQVDYVPENEVARWDPQGRSFFNVNTLADWELAQVMASFQAQR